MLQSKILDVYEVSGKKIKLSNYTHILAYHACRAEDELGFRAQGLKPYTRDEALAIAIRKLESDQVSRKKIEVAFHSLWEETQATRPARVWLMLQTEELLSDSTHYLIYGSEFLNTLAMRLGCRDKLRTIGKPMFVVCAVPISEIPECWLRDIEKDIKNRNTANRSIAVPSVAAENVRDIYYPTGYVRDPYSWCKVKLE